MPQHLSLISLLVHDQDDALAFYVGTLGFTLVEDSHQPAQNKRWVVVSPPGADDRRGCQILLARASDEAQRARVGDQTGGRVFLFLQTDDFWRDFHAWRARGVVFVREPKVEPYGTVAVFEDLSGNRWDLIGPAAPQASSNNLPGLPQLAHPLVSLRPLAAADLEPWYAYLHLPQVHEHTSWDIAGPDALRSHVGTRPGDVNATSWRLAIAWRDGGALAGTVGLNEVSRVHRSAEIAYDLAPDAWGRGIARATCTAVVAWAHERAGLARIQATVMTSNQRSLRVLEHCGFQHEGLMRAYRHFRGRSGDFHRFAHVTPMTAD